MTTDDWSLFVDILVAVGTLGAVVVAIFGEKIRALFKPKVSLDLASNFGHRTTGDVAAPSGEIRKGAKFRYYQLRVSNGSPWPPATQAQVYLTRIATLGPDKRWRPEWMGEVPVRWSFQEFHPLQRTIGPAANADLCSVLEEKWLQLHPLFVPNTLANWVILRGPADIIASFQVKATEGTFADCSFQISWDGKWEDGDLEMSKHLVVTRLLEPVIDEGAR